MLAHSQLRLGGSSSSSSGSGSSRGSSSGRAAAAAAAASPVLRPLPPVCCSRAYHKQGSFTHRLLVPRAEGPAAAAAPAGDIPDAQQQQQSEQQQPDQQQPEQQQPDHLRQQQYTKARARRLSRNWADSNSPNTGLVSITAKSQVSGAAACVAADFKTNRLTRLVPCTADQTQRAVSTLRAASQMVNTELANTAAEQGRDYVKQALAFQPVEVIGDMAAPPALPLGAVILYTACLRADNPELQEALSRRAEALAKGAGSSRRPFSVSSGTDHVRLAGLLSSRLSAEGWVELITQGRQDLALPIAMQAIVKLRRVRYGKHKDDASVLLLGDTDVLGQDGRSLPPAQQGLLPPVSMLILRCAKNYGTQLLPLPAPSQS